MAGVILLAVLYIITLVSAVLATPETKEFFRVSLLATLIIPLVLYVYMLVYRLIFGREDSEEEQKKISGTSENERRYDEKG